jgi:membrane-associated phospholipid phosphatase
MSPTLLPFDRPLLGSRSQVRPWLAAAGLLLAALLVMPFDVDISRVCYKQAGGKPKFLRNVLDNTEPFGHSVGIVFIAAAAFCLDAGRRRNARAILLAGLGSGLAADVLKLAVSRTRPRNFDFAAGDVWGTFQGWLPLLTGGSGGQSLPSAHTAGAVGLAVVLSAAYPRGRLLFAVLVLLVAGHRLHSGAHFPSDILLGALVGWVFGTLCVRPRNGGPVHFSPDNAQRT